MNPSQTAPSALLAWLFYQITAGTLQTGFTRFLHRSDAAEFEKGLKREFKKGVQKGDRTH
jgi:hypothetical protein